MKKIFKIALVSLVFFSHTTSHTTMLKAKKENKIMEIGSKIIFQFLCIEFLYQKNKSSTDMKMYLQSLFLRSIEISDKLYRIFCIVNEQNKNITEIDSLLRELLLLEKPSNIFHPNIVHIFDNVNNRELLVKNDIIDAKLIYKQLLPCIKDMQNDLASYVEGAQQKTQYTQRIVPYAKAFQETLSILYQIFNSFFDIFNSFGSTNFNYARGTNLILKNLYMINNILKPFARSLNLPTNNQSWPHSLNDSQNTQRSQSVLSYGPRSPQHGYQQQRQNNNQVSYSQNQQGYQPNNGQQFQRNNDWPRPPEYQQQGYPQQQQNNNNQVAYSQNQQGYYNDPYNQGGYQSQNNSQQPGQQNHMQAPDLSYGAPPLFQQDPRMPQGDSNIAPPPPMTSPSQLRRNNTGLLGSSQQ